MRTYRAPKFSKNCILYFQMAKLTLSYFKSQRTERKKHETKPPISFVGLATQKLETIPPLKKVRILLLEREFLYPFCQWSALKVKPYMIF